MYWSRVLVAASCCTTRSAMPVNAPLEVSLTVDTEFSIAGHFKNPQQYLPVAEPVVYGTVNGRDEGLGFLLEVFDRFNINASFFVECANYFYFGDEPMRTVVQKIVAAGQDVQLHVHPVWLTFGKGEEFAHYARHDNCNGRSFEELHSAFKHCIEVFQRWTGRKPDAIRTGSLVADDNIFKVMQALDIPLSSNIALGVFEPVEQALQVHAGRHRFHGVMELPVFTYQDMNVMGRTRRKSLQITSCSWPEMRHLLWKARKAGVENVVILTHPFEFVKKSDFRYSQLTRNRVNQNRLEALCRFLAQHPDDFLAADFGSRVEAWTAKEKSEKYLSVPTALTLGRMLHNRLNDTLWRY